MDMLMEGVKASASVGGIVVVSFIAQYAFRKLNMFSYVDEQKTAARKLGGILTLIIAFSFIISGVGKVLAFPPMVEKFRLFGMLHLFPFVGMIEIFVGCLLLSPKTFKLGFMMGTATAGGAIATHLPIHSDGLVWAIPSSTYMTVLWLAGVLLTPEIFPSFLSNRFHKEETFE